MNSVNPKGDFKALLVFPPGWTAYAPYLALPSLASVARQAGYHVDLLDLNVEYYDSVLSCDHVRAQASRCRDLLSVADSWQRKRTLMAAIAYSTVADEVEELKARLRTRGRPIYASEIRTTIETLTRALFVAAASYPGYKLLLNRFELPIDIESISDVTASLDDSSRNPFIPFFNSHWVARIGEGQYSFIGISLTSETQLIPTLTLLQTLRSRLRGTTHITIGGNFVTRLMKTMREPATLFHLADSIVCDEGEMPFLQILEALKSGAIIADIPGVASRGENGFSMTPSKQHDISQLPTPDFIGLPLEKYFSPELILPIYSSRSCFAKCTFCSIPAASGSTYRVRAPETVAKDCRTLASRHHTRYFTFVDETLAPGMMRKISDEFIQKGDSFRWYGETRFGPQFTDDFASRIYAGGCRKLQFGLESYNQRVLDLMRKGVKVEHIEPTLRALFKNGVAAHLFFMVGFPTETEKEARNTDTFTRRMLQESHIVFNNPFTTRGFDVFGLDPLAPVYLEPEYHRISLKQSHSDDAISFRVDYASHEGLSSGEAQSLVEEFRSGLVPLLRNAKRRPPGDYFVEDSEELNFLGACTLAENPTPANGHNQRNLARVVNQPFFSELSACVQVFDGEDVLSVRNECAASEAATVFSPRSGMWGALSAGELDQVRSGSLSGSAALFLNSLDFGRQVPKYAAVDKIGGCYPVSFLDRCITTDLVEGGSVVVLIQGTGRVLTIGLLTYLALRLSSGTKTICDIVNEVRNCAGPENKEQIDSIVADLAELSHLGVVGISTIPVG